MKDGNKLYENNSEKAFVTNTWFCIHR